MNGIPQGLVRRPSRWRSGLAKAVVAASAALLVIAGSARPAAAADDYTQSVTQLNSSQALISFTPTTPAKYVDVHYLPPSVGQQNFRMTNNAGTWQQTVSSLPTGFVLEYWFTYEKNGPQFDTPHFFYTHGGGTGTVATPTFNPPAGTYTTAQSVAISTTTAGASIRYTLDGSTPTASSTLYTGPITISTTTTVKAIGLASGRTNSAVATATYTIGTAPGGFWGDTSNIPAAQNVVMLKILNRTNGQYPDSQVFWSYNGVAHSIAEQPYFDMPVNTAGRMYFYLGSPNSQYFDFIEFTVGPSVFNGNTTRVDAFGLKLAMRLHARDGYDVAVGEDEATFAEPRATTFQKFIDAVPGEFDILAQRQAPYRIIAPGSDATFRAGGVNANYFTSYANANGVNAATSDIFGCAGVLANDPVRCAALNRHVAGLTPAQQADPSLYYQAAPANYYSKFWHDHSINKLSYGFPYDDYANQSSFVSHGNPQWLLIAVGW